MSIGRRLASMVLLSKILPQSVYLNKKSKSRRHPQRRFLLSIPLSIFIEIFVKKHKKY